MRFFGQIVGTVLLAVPLFLGEALASGDYLDPPIDCRSCTSWNEPQAPFRIFGNTYYVGTAGLAVILIVTGDGLILLAPHPFLFRMDEKLEQGGSAFIDGGECAAYAESAVESLERRLLREAGRDQRR